MEIDEAVVEAARVAFRTLNANGDIGDVIHLKLTNFSIKNPRETKRNAEVMIVKPLFGEVYVEDVIYSETD